MKCLNEAGTTESGLISTLFKISNFNTETIYHLKFENKQIIYNSEYNIFKSAIFLMKNILTVLN